MQGQSAIVTPPSANPCTILQQALEEIRASAVGFQPHTDINSLLWSMSEAADRIVSEHNGMAEELLCVYEQLGVIFEVIRNLSTIHNESDVVTLFADSLRSSFSGCDVAVAHSRPGPIWQLQNNELALSEWMGSAIRRACDDRAVMVEKSPGSDTCDAIAELMVGPVYAGGDLVCALLLTHPKSVPEFRASDMMLLESLTKFCGDLICTHRLARELNEMSMTLVRSLVNAVDQKDEYTSGHSVRVGYFATLLGKRLSLPTPDLQMLQWSALLHDTGKLGIRDEVLKKQGKLTQEEFSHVQEHPTRSHKVVQEVPQLEKALDGVLYHHEHYDGTGYPKGLVGEDIPLQARIIQVADVFDALTSTRSYRSAFTWQQALVILEEEAGKTVDPGLQAVFADLIRETLSDKPGAWERLIERAGRCVQVLDEEAMGEDY
ncbi:MAG: HD-GYP domain-containing protein [Phycisphaerales bacterium]|nr:MAG: HD-GYP domain-containing protein [Phycisphaerales bacterium]